MNFVGIDTGSRTVKVAIISDDKIVVQYIDDIGISSLNSSIQCMEEALKKAGITVKDLTYTVSTGYGRALIPFANHHVSDIASHARGAVWLFPTARTILDIGGQDSKAINCDGRGRVIRFVLNEKCAGGTGRFLEVMADLLEVPFEEMMNISFNSQKKIALTSTCVIFAKSEALGMLLEGTEKNDVIAAVHRSIATQSYKLLGKMSKEKDLVLTGGVNKIAGVVKEIKEISNMEPLIPPDPQMVGAIGAAAIARDRYLAKQK
jgi:predicted CoA-substrate-specific enzyme activase